MRCPHNSPYIRPCYLCRDSKDSGYDKPESGKVYRLTGGPDVASVMRGDSLADCEVKESI